MGKKDWLHRYKKEKDKLVYLEFEDWSREDLIDHILQLRNGIEELSGKETGLSVENQAQKELKESDYQQKWSYPNKVTFLIAVKNYPMTSDELHSDLLRLDSHYKDYNNPKSNLTVYVNRAIKSGRIKKLKVPGVRRLYYGLPEWVDEGGKLKKKYRSIYNTFQ